MYSFPFKMKAHFKFCKMDFIEKKRGFIMRVHYVPQRELSHVYVIIMLNIFISFKHKYQTKCS